MDSEENRNLRGQLQHEKPANEIEEYLEKEKTRMQLCPREEIGKSFKKEGVDNSTNNIDLLIKKFAD